MPGYSCFLKEDKETVFLQVFAKLNLKDLIVSRTVCKSWKEMIDLNLRRKTLIVYGDVYPCEFWSFDSSPLKSSESLKVSSIDSSAPT